MKNAFTLLFFVIFVLSVTACNKSDDSKVVEESDSTFTLEGAGE